MPFCPYLTIISMCQTLSDLFDTQDYDIHVRMFRKRLFWEKINRRQNASMRTLDRTGAILFVGICHVLDRRCIGQLYIVNLSEIAQTVWHTDGNIRGPKAVIVLRSSVFFWPRSFPSKSSKLLRGGIM